MFGILRRYIDSLLHFRRSSKPQRRQFCSDLRIEPLEARWLLTANVAFDAHESQIVITGSSGVDEVLVSSPTSDTIRIRLRSEGITRYEEFPKIDVASVSFTGDAGNDHFRNETDIRSIVLGEAGDDVIIGGSGNDFLLGGDGDDSINGGDGNDILRGGLGNDRLRGDAGNDQIFGEAGDDNIGGDAGSDLIYGGNGNDFIRGGLDNDRLRGDAGDDTIYGDEGEDNLGGDEGNDIVHGGEGHDFIRGGLGNDRLRGDDGDDQLFGDDGDDDLRGDGGSDLVYGGNGNDFIRGGTGDDRLRGDDGDDRLYGDDGDDNLGGDGGSDFVYGGNGNDFIRGGTGDDRLRGDDGDDRLFGDDGDDNLGGDGGSDFVYGGNGNDFIRGGTGDDRLRGDDGDDRLYGDEGFDNLGGDDGNDIVEGGDGNDFIRGGIGNDILAGDAGDDQLFGEEGDDVLKGHEGDDYLRGDLGDDRLSGMEGNDRLYGSQGNDWMAGGLGDDMLWGDEGDDQLYGDEGHDVLIGLDGNDLLYASSGNDILIGGNGVDNLAGREGDDLLIGGSTVYDTRTMKLQILQKEWAFGGTYSERIAAIEGRRFGTRLEAQDSVLDDLFSDIVTGGGGSDWFFLTGSMPIYVPVNHTDHEHEHEPLGGHHDEEITYTLPKLEGFALIAALDNLQDVQGGELIHSKVPHASDIRRQAEHLSLFELVRYDEVTHFAISDGDWSNPATWHNRVVPTDGARVLISYGTHVTVDGMIAARLKTVRVDGTLSFATQANSELKVDTIIVSSVGALEMGTKSAPIAPHVRARILITNSGPIDRTWDPYGISRGIISHGHTTIYGATVLEQSILLGEIVAGARNITLADVPLGWKVGDQIVISGTVAGMQEDEVRTIRAISGRTITVSPLTYDHRTLSTEMAVHIAHLTRNAAIESESSATDRRGHVMFMHSRDVDVNYAGFYRLGRTDKLQPINDAVVDNQFALVLGTGTNPRGRYSVHFHRNGLENSGHAAAIHGSAVVDSSGWGFVNHSSNVEMSNNVAFDVRGAAFATEVGDEIGSFRDNIAIRVTGSGEHIESRLSVQDFGHQGDGFWFQGTGISVTGNVAAGAAGHAFIFFSRGLVEGGELQIFRSDNLVDPSIADGASTIKVDFVPMREFTDNIGLASGTGLAVRYNLRDAPHQHQSIFEDSLFWNNSTGVDLRYSHNAVLRDLTIVHSFGAWPQFGIASNAATNSIIYDNLTVAGYSWGIEMARGGSSSVIGGNYSNKRNIVIQTAASPNRMVYIGGPIQFSILPEEIMPNRHQFDIVMRPQVESMVSMHILFNNDLVTLDYGTFQNLRAYYDLQHPDAIPFSVASSEIPLSYVGLTSQQLLDFYGLAIGGELAPLSAIQVPRIGGIVAPI